MKNYRRFLVILLISFQAFLFVACTKDSVENIPSYISVNSAAVNPTSTQGTASHKIVDAWVYAGNDLVGGFELPAKFPVLKSGTTEVSVLAGIKMNGINETRVPYPFYEIIKKTITLEREKISNLGDLRFSYKQTTKFAWQENFEIANSSIEITARSEVSLQRVKLPELATAFPNESNEYAAKVVITNDTSVFECQTQGAFILPTDGNSAFLELNYKSNNRFVVGLVANGSVATQNQILVINPSATWNKIYINLTPTLSANNTAGSFRVFIIATKDTDIPTAEIYFDNFKLVHF